MKAESEKAIKNCLNQLFPNKNNVLIVYDKHMNKITKTFESACKEVFSNTYKLKIKPTGRSGKEPPKKTVNKIGQHQNALLLTTYSLTHTNALKKNTHVYIASMPSFSKEMIPALNPDYKEMVKISKKVKKYFNKKTTIKSKNGTYLTLNSKPPLISATFDTIQKAINLPSGEVFSYVTNTNGTLVHKNKKIKIKNNKITNYNNHPIKNKIKNAKNGNYVAEFGIGTNKKAKIINNILMDEKVLGTCHIAFGDNTGFGGNNKSNVHIDLIIKKPTIIVNKNVIIKNGVPKW